MSQIVKLANKLGFIKAAISLGLILCGLIYGLCIFIYRIETRDIAIQALQEKDQALQLQINELSLKTTERDERLMDRIIQAEKNSLVTSTKMDHNFTRLFADLQYIKERLIDKGLSKD